MDSMSGIIGLTVLAAIVVGARTLYSKFIARSAHKEFQDAQQKDQKIQEQIAEIKQEVVASETREQAIEQKIQDTTEETVPEIWHKQWRPKK